MPYIDNSAGAGNFISAANSATRQVQDASATHVAQIQQIGKSFEQFATNYKKAHDEKTKTDARVAYGHSLGITDDAILADETTGLSAIAEKNHEIATKTYQDWQAAQQERQFAHSDQAQQAQFGHADASQRLGQTIGQEDDVRKQAMKEELSRKLGGEVGQLTADVQTPPGTMEGPPGGTTPQNFATPPGWAKPGEGDVRSRFSAAATSGKPYMIEALDAGLGAIPKPVAPRVGPTRTDAQEDLDKARAERERADAERLKRPPAPAAPRKYEPATKEEAIEFFKATHPQKAGAAPRPGVVNKDAIETTLGFLTPAERIDFDAQMQVRDAASGGVSTKALEKRASYFQTAAERQKAATKPRLFSDTPAPEETDEPAPDDEGAEDAPTPEEQADIDGDPTVKASWASWSAAERAQYLAALRGK